MVCRWQIFHLLSRTSGRLSDAEADIDELEKAWKSALSPTYTDPDRFSTYDWNVSFRNDGMLSICGKCVIKAGVLTSGVTGKIWQVSPTDYEWLNIVGTFYSKDFQVIVVDANGVGAIYNARVSSNSNESEIVDKLFIELHGLVCLLGSQNPDNMSAITVYASTTISY